DRTGKFEQADEGTLFLDEIGTMEASTQVNLLRVIESKQFVRVGGTQVQNSNVRILAATNLDLLQAVQSNEFRRDLYYRLNVFALRLPPLRERPEDIPGLVEYFRQRYVASYDCHVTGIEPEAMKLLQDYRWPGNVRELSNVMTQLVIGAAGKQITFDEVQEALEASTIPDEPAPSVATQDPGIQPSQISPPPVEAVKEARELEAADLEAEPPAVLATGGPARPMADARHSTYPGSEAFDIQPGQTIERVEEELIQTTLRSVNGNRSKAARMLGISRKSLYNKIKAYDIEA
ncbi:MAG: sigma 54-interacting transcriptional regulator, partial [Spirochaetota bacterium]